jgi:hypothetical protein
MGDAATQAAVAIAVQENERRIATATPPNRLTTQRRLLQRAGGDAYGCRNEALWAAALSGLRHGEAVLPCGFRGLVPSGIDGFSDKRRLIAWDRPSDQLAPIAGSS